MGSFDRSLKNWRRAFAERLVQWRWGTFEARHRRTLVRMYDAIAATDFHHKYWMNGGLLLGCIRNGGPISHDTDADFSFWEEDLPKFERARAALQNKGFSLLPTKVCNDGKVRRWALTWGAMKCEFFLMEREGHSIRWVSHAAHVGLELHCAVPMHGVEEISLYGRQWLKPDDHETYLRSLYGDWRTPNPRYRYWKHSQAIVEKQPWSKRAA